MSLIVNEAKAIIFPTIKFSEGGVEPEPQANQFYVPSDNPFADYSEPVRAFWAGKNIEKIYFNGDENYGYDSFPVGSCACIYWSGSDCSLVVATSEPNMTVRGLPSATTYNINRTFTYENKTVYYRWLEDGTWGSSDYNLVQTIPEFNINEYYTITIDSGRRAWLMIYGGYDT